MIKTAANQAAFPSDEGRFGIRRRILYNPEEVDRPHHRGLVVERPIMDCTEETPRDQTKLGAGRTGPSPLEIQQFFTRLQSRDSIGVSSFSNNNCNLIGLLQEMQDCFGYLPPIALKILSRTTRIPLSRIYGVVSFYAQFYTEPRGRHTIRCCRGTACHVRGGKRIIDVIRESLGIDEGQTTEDMMFTFETVGCLGACALAPVAMLDSIYIGKATPEGTENAINNIRAEESSFREQE